MHAIAHGDGSSSSPCRKDQPISRDRQARRSGAAPQFFIVFGHQRTGSTLVASRLNSHPSIVCHEEVFLRWVDSEPSLRGWLRATGKPQWMRGMPGTRNAFVRSLLPGSQLAGKTGAIGFKVMYNQMSLWPALAYLVPRAGRWLEDPVFRSWLHANRVLVIHTLRRNHLKILASHQLAAESGRFHSRDAGTPEHRVVLPVPGLKARLLRIASAERAARSVVRNLPSIEVYYEDYIGARGAADDALLCRALGQPVPATGLASSLTKVASDDLRETVKNYEQIAAHLSGTRFERFLT